MNRLKTLKCSLAVVLALIIAVMSISGYYIFGIYKTSESMNVMASAFGIVHEIYTYPSGEKIDIEIATVGDAVSYDATISDVRPYYTTATNITPNWYYTSWLASSRWQGNESAGNVYLNYRLWCAGLVSNEYFKNSTITKYCHDITYSDSCDNLINQLRNDSQHWKQICDIKASDATGYNQLVALANAGTVQAGDLVFFYDNSTSAYVYGHVAILANQIRNGGLMVWQSNGAAQSTIGKHNITDVMGLVGLGIPIMPVPYSLINTENDIMPLASGSSDGFTVFRLEQPYGRVGVEKTGDFYTSDYYKLNVSFGVYESKSDAQADENRKATLKVSDTNRTAISPASANLDCNKTYYIREIKSGTTATGIDYAGTGYLWNSTIYEVIPDPEATSFADLANTAKANGAAGVSNMPGTWSLDIQKNGDYAGGYNELSNAKFSLYWYDTKDLRDAAVSAGEVSGGTLVATFTTDASGKGIVSSVNTIMGKTPGGKNTNTLKNIPLGWYVLVETAAPKGYFCSYGWKAGHGDANFKGPKTFGIALGSELEQHITLNDTPYLWKLKLVKGGDGYGDSDLYSLVGAEFTIYHYDVDTDRELDMEAGKPDHGTVAAKFATDISGNATVTEVYNVHGNAVTGKGTDTVNLPTGWYLVVETKAPAGYYNSYGWVKQTGDTGYVGPTKYGVNTNGVFDSDGNYIIRTFRPKDTPIFALADLMIFKRDKETGEKQQGSGTFAGAEFTIKYYDNYYDKVSDLPEKANKSWVLRTDENGFCTLSDPQYIVLEKSDTLYTETEAAVFPLGTITIEETNAPDGYTLNNLSFISKTSGKMVSDENGIYLTQIKDNGSIGTIVGGNEYEVEDYIIKGDLELQKTDEAGNPIANVKFSITDISGGKKGESHIVWTDENGYYSTSSSYIKHSKNTNNGQPGSGIWFGGAEVDDSMGALPYGTYEIQELRCDANKEIYKNADPVTVKVEKDNVIVDAGTIIDRAFPIIHTTAKDAVTNNHTSSAALDEVTLTDTVDMSRLDKGHVYTLHTAVMDKETEEVLIVESGDVTAESTFTADSDIMSVDIDVTFSSIGLDGKDVVFFEYLTDSAYPEEIIARHEDINDPDQTIHFVEIHTTATGENGEKVIYTTKDITIKDVVEYQGLTEGETYTVSGVLMDKETEEEFLSNGEIVTAETEFVAEAEDGSVEVEFTFSGVNVGVKEIVAFEELRYGDYVLAVHADIHDEGQTITTTPNPAIIRKKDATTGEEIPGATLSLYDEEGNLVDTWVSTTVPHGVENLAAGTYRLVEEIAPLGYLMAEDVTFEVLADGSVTEVEMFDSYAIVAITKVDAVTGEALEGAEFTLYDAETDEAVMTAVSDEEGYAEFIKIAPGEYYIKETSFPDGYTVDLSNPDNITYVTVEENQYTNAAPIILFNQYSRVCVYKIDSKSKKALAGAEFTLYDAKTDAVAGKAVSDADGYAEFEDVAPGEYYIKETNAPEGYLLSDEKIYIDTSKTNYTMAAPIVMENALEPDTPHTGDTFPILPVAVMTELSIFGMIGVVILKRRRK